MRPSFVCVVKMPYADPQKRRDGVRRWKKTHPDKVRAQKQRYRARRAQDPCPSSLPPRRSSYHLRSRKVERSEKFQLMNLVVVLKDYRKYRREVVDREKKQRKEYRQRNREKILVAKKEYRQRNRDKILVAQKEYRQRNRDNLRIRRKEYVQRNRDKIRIIRKEYRQRNRDRLQVRRKEYEQRNRDKIRIRRKEYVQRNRDRLQVRRKEYEQRNRDKIRIRRKEYVQRNRDKIRIRRKEYRQRNRDKKERVAKDCVCGLCLVCGGFAAVSWASKLNDWFERSEEEEEVEEEEVDSDTSSSVDSELAKELDRMLNEPSECSDLSDEPSECSDFSDDDDEDKLEMRLLMIGNHREQGIQRKLARWEKEREMEEAIRCVAQDLGLVNAQLRDMERAFAQFQREDATVTQSTEYLQTVTITSDLMFQLERTFLIN